jgi:hypothetical protein
VIAYVAVTSGWLTACYASRFVATYHDHPPGVDHDTVIVCNGGPLPAEVGLIFAPMRAQFFARSNEGQDIAGYIEAARGPCAGYDLMLCLGESAYFQREGWLKRFVEAYQRHGPGMYGAFSSNAVRPHMNTTGFACPPKLIAGYSLRVVTKADRYSYEHGPRAFWRQLSQLGYPVRLVTWDGEWEPRMWRMPLNILWRGTQENCLLRIGLCDRWETAEPDVKAKWSRFADQPFA